MMALESRTETHRLSELLAGLANVPPQADGDVLAITLDSRNVTRGALFLACAGTRGHGKSYIDAAVAAGAAAVAVDDDGAPEIRYLRHGGREVPLIPMADLGQRAGEIAGRFYRHPSQALFTIGITGTNGKTSVSHFIAQVLDGEGGCGVVGTLGAGPVGRTHALEHTTPDAVTVHAELARMREAGARAVAMEVSSHGLAQGRVSGVAFDLAVFTNLTPEHLDYHGDMAGYAAAKRRLLERPGLKSVVLNLDDSYGRLWWEQLAHLQRSGATLDGTPAAAGAVVRGRHLQLGREGMTLAVDSPWGSGTLASPLLGRFNASNLLAALAAVLAAGVPFDVALRTMGQVHTVPGRMERFGGGPGRPLIVVDYAHTPDALKQVLRALREHCAGQLWCVFGCGGERDRQKRAAMGRIAESGADLVVITDDNPRGEDAIGIIEAILGGMQNPDAAYVERDRGRAIARAVELAEPKDIVLVAGKGHEDYQQVGEERRPFSDRTEVQRLLGEVCDG